LHSRLTYTPFLPITIHFILKMEAVKSSKTLVSYHNTTWQSQLRRP
jgi:hypothetical protein